MEKYSRWRDAGTGIQPFLTPKPLRTNEAPLKTALFALKNYVVGPPIAAIKLPLVILLGCITWAFNAAGGLLPIPALESVWAVVTSVLLRIILLLFNFYWIPSSTVSLKKGVRRNDRPVPKSSGIVGSGDLIISNHVSYIEVLYLAFRYKPTFVHISRDGTVRPISLWDALNSVGDPPRLDPYPDSVALGDLVATSKRQGSGPIALFPEGTTSNGRGLLKFLPVFKGFDPIKSGCRVHIVAFKYEYQEFSPSFTVGSKLAHVFWMLAQFSNHLEVKRLPADEVSSQGSLGGVEDSGNAMLGQVLRLRKTGLGAQDKLDFLDYYAIREKKKR